MKRRLKTLKGLASACAACVGLVVWVTAAIGQSKLEPYYNLLRPDGPGPFPALMLVPGSPGVVGNRSQQAEELREQGYVVVFVDYLSARGVATGDGDQVPRREIVSDIKEAGSYLRNLSFVHSSRIGAIRWSRGGASILTTLGEVPEDQIPFKAAAGFYPSCRGIQPWNARVPILMLLGALDSASPPEHCQELAKKLPNDFPVKVHVYPDARHSFDRSDLPSYRARRVRGGAVGYNAKAAGEAWEEVRKFFSTRLKQP